MNKEKIFRKIVFVLFLLVITSTWTYSQVQNSTDALLDAIDVSQNVADSLLYILSFFPNDLGSSDERFRLVEELKKDEQIIVKKNGDLDRYYDLGKDEKIRKTALEIKELSYKIYSYECTFMLRSASKGAAVVEKNYLIRLKYNELKKMRSLLEEGHIIGKSYFITPPHESSEFKSYEEYYTQCEDNLKATKREHQSLIINYHSSHLGGFGWFLSSLTFAFFIWLFRYFILDKRVGKLTSKVIESMFMVIFTIFGSVWGLFFIPQESQIGRIFFGGFIGILVFFPVKRILLLLKYHVFKIPKEKRSGTPIDKLGIGEDYLMLLKEEKINTIENLLEANLKELSQNTELQIETLINLRVKSDSLL